MAEAAVTKPAAAEDTQDLTDGFHLLIDALQLNGLNTIYGVPGIPITDFGRMAQAAGIRVLSFRHEQNAGYAAAIAGFLTKRPGVCLTVSAPGFLNGLTALAHATTNCFPMILMSGSSEREIVDLQQGDYEEMDQLNIARPHCKAAFRILNAEDIGIGVARAIRAAVSGRPGGVYLDLPGKLLAQVMDAEEGRKSLVEVIDPTPAQIPAPAAVKRALEILKSAKRPLIILGKGAAYAQADEAIRQFVETSGVPFLPMSMAKGLLPDTHPQSAGAARSLVLKDSDVVMLVGARLNWLLSHGKGKAWREPHAKRFIQIDIEPKEMDSNVGIAAPVVGDIGSSVTALLDGRPLVQFGDGLQTRDFTFVADIVAANISAATRGRAGGVYNIGGGSRVSMNQVVALIEKYGADALRFYLLQNAGMNQDIQGVEGPLLQPEQLVDLVRVQSAVEVLDLVEEAPERAGRRDGVGVAADPQRERARVQVLGVVAVLVEPARPLVDEGHVLHHDAVEVEAGDGTFGDGDGPLHDQVGHVARRQAQGVHRFQRDQRPLTGERHVRAVPRVGVEDDDALGLVGVVGEGEGVGGPGVPHAVADTGVHVEVAQEHQVGPQFVGVDLDLVDVAVAGLDLRHPGMGDEQVDAVEAPVRADVGEGVERGVHGQHLRDGVYPQPRQVEVHLAHPAQRLAPFAVDDHPEPAAVLLVTGPHPVDELADVFGVGRLRIKPHHNRITHHRE